SAFEKAVWSGPGSVMVGFFARPFASAKMASFVDMSSSMVRLLKLFGMAALRAACSIGGVMLQSVATTAIIVAIWGAIIPLPLQMADRVTVLPPSFSVRDA